MTDNTLYKYPRTYHLEGSNQQPGDEDLDRIPFAQIQGRHVVVEEKLDGSNSGISLAPDGRIQFQSRGHYLSGGGRELHFAALKQFGYAIAHQLTSLLDTRYILYGEWLYAKHTIFYDQLPHHLSEFDLFDKQENIFLDTARRYALLAPLRPMLSSVPVLYTGVLDRYEQLVALVGHSTAISRDVDIYRQHFTAACADGHAKFDIEARQTDLSGQMEGLYIKVEEDGVVKERYKWVRRGFLQIVFDSHSHWQDRPIVRNAVRERTDVQFPG